MSPCKRSNGKDMQTHLTVNRMNLANAGCCFSKPKEASTASLCCTSVNIAIWHSSTALANTRLRTMWPSRQCPSSCARTATICATATALLQVLPVVACV